MPPFVGRDDGEQRAERESKPFRHRRGDTRAGKVEPVGSPQAIDVRGVMHPKRRHHRLARFRPPRLKHTRRSESNAGGRLGRAQEKAPRPGVPERTLGIRVPAACGRNRFIQFRHVGSGGGVQVIEAFRDGPRVRRRPPNELIVPQCRHERVDRCGHSLKLMAELVDLRRQRGRTGWHDGRFQCEHDRQPRESHFSWFGKPAHRASWFLVGSGPGVRRKNPGRTLRARCAAGNSTDGLGTRE
jgi:hypothetical protein